MTDVQGPTKKHFPRDFAGSLELEGGTGEITAMCSCAEFLEVYKEDVTFRVQTPESIDPGRTNPNASFVAAMVDSVGSSSPAVARILLQCRGILDAATFERPVDKSAIVQDLHSCKEAVVVCEKVATRVAGRIDAIVADIEAGGVKRDSRGGALNPFPQVPDLDSDATAFLIHAKRAIHAICLLPVMFLPVPPKDNNFDDLAKTLEQAVGHAPITEFVLANAPEVRHLIELRNLQEHPGTRRTVIDNFAVTPDGQISQPMWYVSGKTPGLIAKEMPAAAEFLVEMAEAMLIYLVMHTVDKRFPFIIQEYEAANINPKMPTKYRLSVDLSKLKKDDA